MTQTPIGFTRSSWLGLFSSGLWLVLSLVMGWALPVQGAQAPPAPLVMTQEGPVDLSPEFEILEDPTHSLTLEALRKGSSAWRPNKRNDISFGFSKSTWWARIRIKNGSNNATHQVIDFDTTLVDYLDTYILRQNNKTVTHTATGDRRVFSSRNNNQRKIITDINLSSNEEIDFYIQLRTHDGFHEPIKPQIQPKEILEAHTQNENIAYSLYHGALASILIYNLALFASTKQKTFGYYVLYLTSFLMWSLSLRGFTFQYVLANDPDLSNNLTLTAACLSGTGASLFCMEYLSLKKWRHQWIFKTFLITSAITGALSTLPVFFNFYALTLFGSSIIIGLQMALMFITAALSIKLGSTEGKYFAIAFGAICSGILIFTFRIFGIIPSNPFTENFMLFGSTAEFLILAFGLANQINTMKAAKLNAEREALILQTKLNTELEKLVNTRTEELNHSNERNQTVIDNVSEGIVVMQNRKMVFANPKMLSICQEPFEVLSSKRLSDWIHPDDKATLRTWVTAAGEATNRRERIRFVNTHRQITWMELSMAQISWEGQPAILSFVSDITERLQLDAALKESLAQALDAKKQADAANATKGEFLAIMSHELRTPIAGVIGLQNLTLRDKSIPPDVRQKISMAQGSAQSLLTIVNDLLDLSKIEAGKFQIELIDFELRADLNQALSVLIEKAKDKGVDFNLDIDPLLPHYVLSDPTRLRQVLINLVGNALKFTAKGSVDVSARISEQQGDVFWTRFEVKDSGIGISAEAMSRLFQKFEQAESSTSREFGGTGLGLSITKQIVELMGGSIGVRSTPGQGSTFYFDLPLKAGVAPVVELSNTSVPHPYSLRVLCAEDALTNQMIIKALLDEMGHQVDMVENGERALHALAHHDYDLILMDGRMPVMDGIAATQCIREGHFGDWTFADPNIMIVALTANASDHDREKFLAAGMDAFLTKPINETQLHITLSSAIGHCLANGKTLQAMGGNEDLSALDALLGLEAPNEPTVAEQEAPSLMQKMTQVFISQVPERLAEIHQAMLDQNYPQVAIVVHGLRGSMAYVWPDSPLIALTEQLEKWADEESLDALGAGIQSLNDSLQAQLTAAGSMSQSMG